MVTVTDVGPLGTITLYDNGTDVWEIGGGDYGLAGPGQAGSGAPLSGYAGSVEGTLGQVAGALDMQGLASGTGYLDIEAQEIQGAQPAGTGSVDGVPVTIYKLSESGLLDPDIGGLTPQQSATIRAADAIIASSGFAGKTTWLSVDSEGYIREQKTEYTLPDGSVVTGDTILSNFGCAGTVVMPGQVGSTAPPAGCVSPDHAGAGSTVSPTTLPPSAAPTTEPTTTPSTSPPPPPSTTGLDRPEGLAVEPDGDLLIVNQGTNQILRRLPDGTLHVVAGTGVAGYSGDGGPAVQAELDRPSGIAVAPDGTIYVADTFNNRVRTISPTGIITTVAGDGQSGDAQSGGGPSGAPAPQAALADPQDVAVGPQGQLYIADSAGIQVVSDGTLTTLNPSGLGALGIGSDGGVTASAITVDQAGDLYVGDFSPKMLVELSPTGEVLQTWGAYVAPGGGLATAPDGSIVVADFGFTVDRVSDGQLTHIATFSLDSVPGVTGALRPSAVAVTPSGTIYVDTDGANGGTDTPVLGVLGAQGQLQVLSTSSPATPLPG
jgi:sugar lactone lactonase YvrE